MPFTSDMRQIFIDTLKLDITAFVLKLDIKKYFQDWWSTLSTFLFVWMNILFLNMFLCWTPALVLAVPKSYYLQQPDQSALQLSQ